MPTFEDKEPLSLVRAKINDAITSIEGTNSFSRVAVAGQGNVDADGKNSTLNLEAGSNITITTNSGTDTVTISSTAGGGVTDGDKGDITVSGSGTVWTIDNGAVDLATKVSGVLPATSFNDTAHGARAGGTLHADATTSVSGFMSGADKTKLNGIATGANLYVHPNHTGDVTSVADGATTIAANAVTNAKLAQAVANTLKGNNTGATANVADLTTSQVKTMLAITTADVSGLGTLATQSGTFSGTSSGTNTGDQLIFQTIAVSGQSNVVADTTADTLTLAAGTGTSITTNAATDTITFTNTAPDQVVALTQGGTVTVSGTYPNFTISGAATNLGYTASTRALTSSTGTGVTLPLFSSTDAGLAPASGGGTTNFLRADGTWAAPAGGGGGGVTTFSAGTTGLTPSTATSGAVTLAGTLGVPNGGTGATTLTGYVKGTGTTAMTASATIPNTDITGLGTISTQDANNVSITGGTIAVNDTNFTLRDDADNTKQLQFQLSGITTGTTRTITVPNQSATMALAGGGSNTFTGTNIFNDNAISIRDNTDTSKAFVFEASGITTATTRTLTVPDASGTLALTSNLGTIASQNAASVSITGGSITGITDLAIADGGTGASDAATARTNLGLGTLATQSGTFSGTSSGTNTGDQNIFQNIAVSGQTTVVADTTTDTLTLAAGTGIGITTNATTDTITITNSAPDQTVSLTQGGTVTVTGTYPSFTITGAATNIAEGTRTTTTVPITSSTGTGATLSAATTSLAGVMSSADKTKLDGIAAGAQVNVATDLSYTASSRLLASSTGTDVTLPLFTSTEAGLTPLSGGGTANFLRADGTWTAPVATVAAPVQLASGSEGTPTYSFSADTNTGIYNPNTDEIGFSVAGSRLLNLATPGWINAFSTSSFFPIFTLENATADANPPILRGSKSRAFAATAVDDSCFLFGAQASDGTGFSDIAGIRFDVDNTVSTGITPGRIVFRTTDSAGVQQERLRVTSSGAWGLSGANYGIQGDVLTSNGSSAAPTWGGAEYWIAQNATYTLTSTTAAQKIFNATTNGTLTLPVGTYEYEAIIYLTSMSGTSGNGAFNLRGAGTATISSALSQALGQDAAIGAGAAQGGSYWTGTTSNAAIVTAATGTAIGVSIRGWFRVSVAGTIIPSIALTTAAAAIVQPNTYMVVKRRDASATAVSFGPWT